MDLFKKAIITLGCFILLDLLASGILKKGMTTYYNFTDEATILFVGHSHTVLGVDTDSVKKQLGLKASKYAIAGANVLDRYWMIKHYLDIHPDVQIVVYGVDTRLFDSERLSSASYTLFFPFMDNKIMGRYLHQQASWDEYYVSKFIRTARFRDQTLNISLRGLLNKSENRKTGKIQMRNYQTYLEIEKKQNIRVNYGNVKCFYDTMEYLVGKSKRVFLIHLPVIDILNQIDSPNQEKALHIFQEIDTKYENIHFLNYNSEYENNYNLFFDPRHLNETGKRIITNRLVVDIKKYLNIHDEMNARR